MQLQANELVSLAGGLLILPIVFFGRRVFTRNASRMFLAGYLFMLGAAVATNAEAIPGLSFLNLFEHGFIALAGLAFLAFVLLWRRETEGQGG